jgi:hypothetical protein
VGPLPKTAGGLHGVGSRHGNSWPDPFTWERSREHAKERQLPPNVWDGFGPAGWARPSAGPSRVTRKGTWAAPCKPPDRPGEVPQALTQGASRGSGVWSFKVRNFGACCSRGDGCAQALHVSAIDSTAAARPRRMAGRFYLQDLLRPASPARAGSCFWPMQPSSACSHQPSPCVKPDMSDEGSSAR